MYNIIRKLLRLIRLIVRKLTKTNSIVISSAINLCTYTCLQRGEVRTFTPWTNAPPHCNPQWRNHVFKVGVVQFLGLGYYTEQNTDGIPSFVHCSLQLRKKFGWSVQILGGPDPPPRSPSSGCALGNGGTFTPKIVMHCTSKGQDRKCDSYNLR